MFETKFLTASLGTCCLGVASRLLPAIFLVAVFFFSESAVFPCKNAGFG